jgi:heat shock 70kDa protein 4
MRRLQVSFTAKNRQLGTDAVGSLTVNPKNTVSQLKRLLGKRFQDPQVQEDIKQLPYKVSAGSSSFAACIVQQS